MAARKKQIATILGGTLKEKNAPNKVRPFPEIIDEEDWEVREGRYPSYIKRSLDKDKPSVMQVPLGGTEIDRKIRLHEQAHVAWTPPIQENDARLDQIHNIDTLNATEDARIIELMNRSSPEWESLNTKEVGLLTPAMQMAFQDGFGKLATHLRGIKEETVKGKAPEKVMSLLEAARLIASTRGYAEGHIFDQIAASAGLDWVSKEVEKMHKRFITSKESPNFDNAIQYAETLEYFFEDKQREIEAENEAMAESGMMDSGYYEKPSSEPGKPIYTPPTIEKGKPSSGDKENPYGTTPKRTKKSSRRWGEMTIVRKKLVDKLAAREARRVRPSDVGAVPRYMHRLMSDQRIFGRRRKKKAFEGTVLLDCSGSMRLDPEMVDDILCRWPAVTVATYNGSRDKGQLWIVASKGKRARADDLKPPHGGNVIDGPALDWLAKQKMPRVWISDGGVTGAASSSGDYESAGYDFIADAALKMKRGRIKRLANVQSLLRGDGNEDYQKNV